MTITQVITALPPAPNPLTDTPSVFSERAAAFVAAQQVMVPELNAFRTQANALETNVNAKEAATDADAIATAADRVQTGADRLQTGLDRAAAQAAAASAGAAAAFSDANTIAKNAADISKSIKFDLSLLSTGTERIYQWPNKNGRIATTDDTALVLLASVTPANNALTIDFLNVFSAAYDNYLIKINTLEGSSSPGDFIRLRFAVAGVVDSNARYQWSSDNSSTTYALNNTDTSARVLGNIYNVPLFGNIEIFNANGTNTVKGWRGDGCLSGTNPSTVVTDRFQGFYIGASAVSGFRLFVSGSAAKFLAKGSIEVYGFKKVM